MVKFLLTQTFIASLFLAYANTKQFEPDMEVKIKGLVCDSCGIGIKRKLKKYPTHVVEVKFNTRKEIALIDFAESKSGRVYWLKNEQIIKAVKDAGYEVTSIKRLDNIKPNRYNKP
jgi:copper chaperone CopZ